METRPPDQPMVALILRDEDAGMTDEDGAEEENPLAPPKRKRAKKTKRTPKK